MRRLVEALGEAFGTSLDAEQLLRRLNKRAGDALTYAEFQKLINY